MNIEKTLNYTINQHFICAIIYGDLSGLNEDDTKTVSEFIELIGLATVEIIEDTEDFRRCDICHLYADTVEINLHYFKNKKAV